MRFLKTSFIILLISLLAIPCFAEVPMLIEAEGQLVIENPNGKTRPYPPGSYDVMFCICADAACTDIRWAEIHYDIESKWGGNDRAKYKVLLGETNPLNVLDFNEDYWLLTTEDTRGYRKLERLVTEPYGMRAEWANWAINSDKVYDSMTGEYKNLQDITINEAYHAVEADNADTLDGVHAAALEESAEIDADIAAHTAIEDAHHTKTTSFTELTDTATDAQIPDDITIEHATTADDADTVDGAHAAALEESAEIDEDIATHTAIEDAHHTKTTSFTELTDSANDCQIPNDITIEHAATAGNADTVDGVHAAALEESAEIVNKIVEHTADDDAHHTKTTSFTELTDTATDAQIPNDITIEHATTANSANIAGYADSAGNADTANSANTAGYADSAGNANTANSAATAGFADEAERANGIVMNTMPPDDDPEYGDMYYDEHHEMVLIYTPAGWKAIELVPVPTP